MALWRSWCSAAPPVTFWEHLGGTVEQDDKLSGGILSTLWQPTTGMVRAANTSGTFKDPVGNSYPLVQLVTVEDLLAGTRPQFPLVIPPTRRLGRSRRRSRR